MNYEEASKEIVNAAVKAIEDTKGIDIKVIDVSQISTLCDYFVIASGSNRNQVQAICDHVSEAVGRAGHDANNVEGYDMANWILMDCGDVIIHIFDKDSRGYYDLERIWRDGKSINS